METNDHVDSFLNTYNLGYLSSNTNEFRRFKLGKLEKLTDVEIRKDRMHLVRINRLLCSQGRWKLFHANVGTVLVARYGPKLTVISTMMCDIEFRFRNHQNNNKPFPGVEYPAILNHSMNRL